MNADIQKKMDSDYGAGSISKKVIERANKNLKDELWNKDALLGTRRLPGTLANLVREDARNKTVLLYDVTQTAILGSMLIFGRACVCVRVGTWLCDQLPASRTLPVL